MRKIAWDFDITIIDDIASRVSKALDEMCFAIRLGVVLIAGQK